MMRMTDMVKHLLIINIIFYIGTYLVQGSFDLLALHYFETDKFKLWQPLSHMFLHDKSSIMHIFFNMFALVSFGSPLEHYWGEKRFLLFYFVCGLGAAFIHSLVNYFEIHQTLEFISHLNLSANQINEIINADYLFNVYGIPIESKVFELGDKLGITDVDDLRYMLGVAAKSSSAAVGASGAIYGLLVAFAFMFPNAELGIMFVPIPVKAKYFVPAVVLMDLFSGVTGFSIFGGGIAHFAHVGGALFGFILMWIWRNRKFKHNRWN